MAAAAARRASVGDLAAIEETLQDLAQAADSPSFRSADRRFHQRVAQASGNSVLVAMVDSLWAQMFTPIFERLGRRTGLLPERRDLARDEHMAIVAAIGAHDPEAARRAMGRHLGNVEAILTGERGDEIVRQGALAEASR